MHGRKLPQIEWLVQRMRRMGAVQHVLDIGGGRGDLGVLVAETFPACRVTIVDLNQSSLEQGIAYAKKKGPQVANRMAFICAPFVEGFDIVKALNEHCISTCSGGSSRVDGAGGGGGGAGGESQSQSQVDFVLALHACGGLSDLALDYAAQRHCQFLVTPCCYPKNPYCVPVSMARQQSPSASASATAAAAGARPGPRSSGNDATLTGATICVNAVFADVCSEVSADAEGAASVAGVPVVGVEVQQAQPQQTTAASNMQLQTGIIATVMETEQPAAGPAAVSVLQRLAESDSREVSLRASKVLNAARLDRLDGFIAGGSSEGVTSCDDRMTKAFQLQMEMFPEEYSLRNIVLSGTYLYLP
jgi:hypothetical protein